MKQFRALKTAMHLGSAVLLSLLLSVTGGCEPEMEDDYSGVDAYFEANPYAGGERDEPSPASLAVKPDFQTIGFVGERVVFEGKGGVGPYAWSVSNPDHGRIDVLGWSEAVYTCVKVGNNYVTVRDREGHFAVASISPVEDTLTITPSSVNLSEVEYHAAFSVNGGSAPYTWSVGNPSMGTISYSADTSYTAGYTAVDGAFGVNVVTVMDAEGRTASATVTRSTGDDD